MCCFAGERSPPGVTSLRDTGLCERTLCVNCAVASRGKGLCAPCPRCGLCSPVPLRRWSCFTALTDHTPPFSAFSPSPPAKSIFEGSFGCGYLKERRASGLVFCENTASVCRALFVSSPCSSCVFMETARMRTGLLVPSSGVEWRGMLHFAA